MDKAGAGQRPTAANDARPGVARAFYAVTTLFFAWGFITSLLDPLIGAVKGIFVLTDVQAQLSAFAFFIAYLFMSFPAAALLARWQSHRCILLALGTMVTGCLVILAAANIASYWLVLAGLFILSSGITILQVAANPLAAALGPPERSHLRLTLSQTFNSLGTFIGPLIGAALFLEGIEVKPGTATSETARAAALGGIDLAYFWIMALIVLLGVFFFFNRRLIRDAAPAPASTATSNGVVREALGSRWAVLGAAAIFLYVGAEVAIGAQMVFFLNSDPIWGKSDAFFALPLLSQVATRDAVVGLSLQQAGQAVALYWGGAMIGRAVGSALLVRVSAPRLLMVFAAVAAAMCLYVVMVGGVGAGFVALSIGLFNSIMFPVIFTLTLERSSASEAATSGLLCTAIVGGAFLPLAVGWLSDRTDYATALIIPALCYGLILAFGLIAARTTPIREATADTVH